MEWKSIFWAGLIIFFMTGCKDPAPGPEPDPCLDAQPFTAHINMYEHVGDSLIRTDRALLYNVVTFEASAGYTFRWSIGEDDRNFEGRTVTLRFLEDAVGPVPVRLYVTSRPNPCVPDDNGLDTVEQVLRIIPWYEAPIIGKYKGQFASRPGEEQVVEIKYISPEEVPEAEPHGGFQFLDINKGCVIDYQLFHRLKRGAMAMGFNAYDNYIDDCRGPKAWYFLEHPDTLSLECSYAEVNSTERFYDSFRGSRVRD
jgi:hypothetical protein